VEQLRQEIGHDGVPYVDPTLAGVNARVMLLLETPSRVAVHGSSMISPDNDDPTAANVWELYERSGLRRDHAIHWNAVPWFLGTEAKNQNASRSDIVGALPALHRLIVLLPHLRLVVTMGEIARRAFALYLLSPEARLVPWLAVAHPGPRVRNTWPPLWGDIERAFTKAKCIVNDGIG
jgi:uracil-DNA glycosylase